MRVEFPEAAFLIFLFIPVVAMMIANHKAGERGLSQLGGGARFRAFQRILILKNFFRGFFFLLGLSGIILQLMGISWNKVPDHEAPEGLDVAMVFDVSRSMLASDHEPSRLQAVQAAAFTAMETLKDSWFSVTAFKGAGVTLVPLTQDALAVRNTISRLSPAMVDEPGTSLDKGIRAGVRSLAPLSMRRKVLMVFSDLEYRAGYPLAAIREALREGIQVIVVGAGSRDGARVPHPVGGFMRDEGGNTVITRFNTSLFRILGDTEGVETFHVDSGLLAWAAKLGEFQGGGIAMVLRPESTGTFFLLWAAFFFVMAWLVRVVKWKDFF